MNSCAASTCQSFRFKLPEPVDLLRITPVYDAKDGIHAGMSGSPVLLGDGSAIGVVCVASGANPRLYTEGGPNPRLMTNLPGWCLRALAID